MYHCNLLHSETDSGSWITAIPRTKSGEGRETLLSQQNKAFSHGPLRLLGERGIYLVSLDAQGLVSLTQQSLMQILPCFTADSTDFGEVQDFSRVTEPTGSSTVTGTQVTRTLKLQSSTVIPCLPTHSFVGFCGSRGMIPLCLKEH